MPHWPTPELPSPKIRCELVRLIYGKETPKFPYVVDPVEIFPALARLRSNATITALISLSSDSSDTMIPVSTYSRKKTGFYAARCPLRDLPANTSSRFSTIETTRNKQKCNPIDTDVVMEDENGDIMICKGPKPAPSSTPTATPKATCVSRILIPNHIYCNDSFPCLTSAVFIF